MNNNNISSDSEEDEKSKIQRMIEEMKVIKDDDKQKQSQVQYRRNKKNVKINKYELQAQIPPPKTKEEVYNEMKQKQKNSWKQPGQVNEEFSKVPVLRGKVLTEWEYERIYLAERSYKAPPNYKGFKSESQGKEFGVTGLQTLPEAYQNYLRQFKDKFDDFQHRPSKYGKIDLDHKLDTFQIMNKDPFKLTNSVQKNSFGFDKHSTWEFEINEKLKTQEKLKATQSMQQKGSTYK